MNTCFVEIYLVCVYILYSADEDSSDKETLAWIAALKKLKKTQDHKPNIDKDAPSISDHKEVDTGGDNSDGHNSDNENKDNDCQVRCDEVSGTKLDKPSGFNDSDDKVCDSKASDTDNECDDKVDEDTDNCEDELILNLELPSELVKSVKKTDQTLPLQDQPSDNVAGKIYAEENHDKQCHSKVSHHVAASDNDSKNTKNENLSVNSQALSSGNAVFTGTKDLSPDKTV